MKILRFLLTAAIISTFFLASCKKGENDPLLSLRSRKARLVGEWTLKSGFENYKVNSIDIEVEYDESSKTINANEYAYTEKLIFRKNGQYEWIYTDNNAKVTEKGSWEFGRKNKDKEYKAKETVVLYISEITTKGGESSESEYFEGDFILLDGHFNIRSIRLDELRNNKLVLVSTGIHQVEGQSIDYESEKLYEQ